MSSSDMCHPHGNFFPCQTCDENIKENGIENTAKSEKAEAKKENLSEYILKWWKGDAHTHSKESTREDYGYAEGIYDIKEILDYYKKIGLEFACFSEHASKPGAPSKQSAESPVSRSLLEEAEEIALMNRERKGDVAGFSSVEANIIFDENGEPILDIPQEVLQKLDMVIASRHAISNEKEPWAIKKSLLAAVKNNSVDAIGHPDRYARKDGEQPQEYWDEYYGMWGEVLEETAQQGKAFEINLNTPPDEKLLKMAIDAGLKFFINFDAHDFGQYKTDGAEIVKKGEEAKGRWAKGKATDEDLKKHHVKISRNILGKDAPIQVEENNTSAAQDSDLLNKYKEYRLSGGPGVRPILKLARMIKKLEKAGMTPEKVINSSRGNLLKFLIEERGKSTENLEYLNSINND